jgi:hypothetical protein
LLVQLSDDPLQGCDRGQILAALEEWSCKGLSACHANRSQACPCLGIPGEARQHENGYASFYAHLYALETQLAQPSELLDRKEDGYDDLQKHDFGPETYHRHVFYPSIGHASTNIIWHWNLSIRLSKFNR